MKRFDLVRALKNRSYRDGLNQEQSEKLGVNPAGMSELDESLLGSVGGATNNGCGGGGTRTPTFCVACRE